MAVPRIPTPAPRRVRRLPIIAMVVGSGIGLAIFLVLWNVAVELQRQNVPQARQQEQVWEAR